MRLWHTLNRRLRLRYRIEYGLCLVVLYLCRAASPAFAWSTARRIGRLAYRLGVRRRAMLANLAVAFPELDRARHEEIARQSFEHFASVIVDIVFQRRMISRRNVRARIRSEGWAGDYLENVGVQGLRQRARRALMATAHFGNWELGAGIFGLLGVPVTPVFRAMRNPYFDGLLRRIRLDAQTTFIERRGAVPAMLEVFERGGNVGFLFDQEAVQGTYVPFFGVDACTHKTPAVLARDHGVKLFFGVVVRDGDFFRYRARGSVVEIPRTDDRAADVRAILRRLMELLEAEIRRRPEQYLWAHRRWKRVGVHGAEHLPLARRIET